jgi:hypothetical protein
VAALLQFGEKGTDLFFFSGCILLRHLNIAYSGDEKTQPEYAHS